MAVWPVIVAVIGVVLFVAQARHFRWTLDDAYIVFAYAQNWVHGHGLVFNIGERVEGYTCFLWVALSALGLTLGFDVVRWSAALGVLSALVAVVGAWQLGRELAPLGLRTGAVFVIALVGGYPALAWWANSGMETALFSALLTAAVWRHARHGAASVLAPCCLALASLTRPEGWLLSTLLCLDALREGGLGKGCRYVGVFLGIFAPYYVWRCWYYGFPLPNTFYAKVGYTSDQLVRGLTYLQDFLTRGGGAVLVLGLALAVSVGIWRRIPTVVVFLALYVGYVVAVGGDIFFFFRFFLPIVPVLAALAVAGVLRAGDRLWPGRSGVTYCCCAAYAALFLMSCVPLFRAQAANLPSARFIDAIGWHLCAIVRERTDTNDEIATAGIGLLKFCTGRAVIDMLGLTDKHVGHQDVAAMGQGLAGHEKYDSGYILGRWPKVIMIPTQETFPMLPAIADMRQQPLFNKYYVPDNVGYWRIDEHAVGRD